MILSGTIRWRPDGSWATISDAAHEPVGFGVVECLPDRVRVHYAEPVSVIHSVQVTPDEAFTAAGVRCGASVGLEFLDVQFFMSGASPVPPALLSRAGANVWITGHFS